jgi:hypothetical protein
VIEIDIRRRGRDERDVCNLRPVRQRHQRQALLGRVQVAEIVGDRVAGPMMGNAVGKLGPIAVHQIVGELRDRADGLAGTRSAASVGVVQTFSWDTGMVLDGREHRRIAGVTLRGLRRGRPLG